LTEIETTLAAEAARVERALDRLLPPESDGPEPIHRAMRYSVFAGGKRFRPVLCLSAFAALDGEGESALPAACALELIHTYSLVHDDLPALDDDALRRGRPTSHVVFGEATAILAGDALLTLAFEVLASSGAEAVRLVARAAGTRGMIGGQVRDIAAEGTDVSLEALERIHGEKTGALIRASCELGGLLAGGAPDAREALGLYGERVGLAFQIADDLLDVEGTADRIGKPVGSDARHGKRTFASALGSGAARARALGLVREAEEIAARLPRGERLAALARFAVERTR
jgi:geranylgeranyl pyrophosphate synthase